VIKNAKIVGKVDLWLANLARPLVIEDSRFEDDVSFNYGSTDSVLDLSGSFLTGALSLLAFRSQSDFPAEKRDSQR
jgi:hypothetical protein